MSSVYGEAVYGVDFYEAEGNGSPSVPANLKRGTMITIERLFEVFFADKNISMSEIKLFAEDHLAKLTEENTNGDQAGQYADLIAALGPKLTAFQQTMSTEDSAQAEREGETITKDEAFAAFKALVSQREIRIADRVGRPSAAYEEFFPHGLTEYGKANMGTALTLMDRMVAKTTKYETQLGGPDLKNEFTAARAAFVDARETQVEQKGQVTGSADARRTAKLELAVQLQFNALIIASKNIGHPERVTVFFDQSKLRDPKKKKDEPAPPPPGP